MSSEFHVLGNTVECPGKLPEDVLENTGDVLGNTGNVLDVLGNTGNRNVLDALGNTAGSVPGLSGSEHTSWIRKFSWGCPRKYRNVLENAKMSRIFPHVLENPKSDLSSELKTFDAHLDAFFY